MLVTCIGLEMNIINFLACPLVHSSTDFRLTNKERLVLEHVSGFGTSSNKSYGYGVDVSQNHTILETHGMERVKDFMVNFTKDFVKNKLKIKQEFYLTQSWSTKNAKDDRHHMHTHANTLLSCVYYVQAECPNSGKLTLANDHNGLFPHFNLTFEYEEYNNYNSKSWTFDVKTGDIVLFPGYLSHFSTPNESDIDRIVIGANFFTRGKFGTDNTIDLMEIK